jgi:hypothetical protein
MKKQKGIWDVLLPYTPTMYSYGGVRAATAGEQKALRVRPSAETKSNKLMPSKKMWTRFLFKLGLRERRCTCGGTLWPWDSEKDICDRCGKFQK